MSSGRAVILLSARRTSRRSVASHAKRASSILFRDASKVRTPAGKRGSWRASFPEMSRTRRRTHARRSGKGDASAFRDATSVSSAGAPRQPTRQTLEGDTRRATRDANRRTRNSPARPSTRSRPRGAFGATRSWAARRGARRAARREGPTSRRRRSVKKSGTKRRQAKLRLARVPRRRTRRVVPAPRQRAYLVGVPPPRGARGAEVLLDVLHAPRDDRGGRIDQRVPLRAQTRQLRERRQPRPEFSNPVVLQRERAEFRAPRHRGGRRSSLLCDTSSATRCSRRASRDVIATTRCAPSRSERARSRRRRRDRGERGPGSENSTRSRGRPHRRGWRTPAKPRDDRERRTRTDPASRPRPRISRVRFHRAAGSRPRHRLDQPRVPPRRRPRRGGWRIRPRRRNRPPTPRSRRLRRLARPSWACGRGRASPCANAT